MNKFAILALFAFVASALVAYASQMPYRIPDDSVETAGMTGEYKQFFEEFCLSMPGGVRRVLAMHPANGPLIQLFLEFVYNVSGALGIDGEGPAPGFWNGIHAFEHTEEGKKKLPMMFEVLKQKLINAQVHQFAPGFCSFVQHAEKEINQRLRNYQLSKQTGDETRKFIGISLYDLGCLSAKRITKVSMTCSFIWQRDPQVLGIPPMNSTESAGNTQKN